MNKIQFINEYEVNHMHYKILNEVEKDYLKKYNLLQKLEEINKYSKSMIDAKHLK